MNKKSCMLNLFENKSSKYIKIQPSGKLLNCESLLQNDAHVYVYSERISTSCSLDDAKKVSILLLATSGLSLSCAVIFLDEQGNKIGGKVFPANQVSSLEFPDEAMYYKLAIRFFGPGKSTLLSLAFGDPGYVMSTIEKHNSFKFEKSNQNDFLCVDGLSDDTPLVFIETVFCDTEKNNTIIERYLSFFLCLVHLVALQSYRNFVWIINISSDKGHAIDKIRIAIGESNLSSNVLLNIFDHPGGGYDNENESHIDRLRRPNSTYPERRDHLFNTALNKIGFDKNKIKLNNLFIRIALDDDDFISPCHLSNIVGAAKDKSHLLNNEVKYLAVGLNRVWISYFLPGGAVEVHDVELSRMMTGSKFSLSRGEIPISPFAITERFEDVVATPNNKNVLYIEHELQQPSFSYNRHGGNFSNQSKKMYYTKKHEQIIFNAHSEMLGFITTSQLGCAKIKT